ncbi:TlpA family protein disulfide reductase [bacterium]|nr:TlpA family protein disulfide reductase [bacterium]
MERKKIVFILLIGILFFGFTFVNIRDISGNLVNLRSQTQNKVILLDFFATTCKPCMNELPHLKKLVDGIDNKNFQFYAISEDGSNITNEAIKKFLKENFGSDAVNILRDIYHQQYTLNQKVKGPISIPRNVLLKNGKVILDIIGYHEDTIGKLNKAIKGNLVAPKKHLQSIRLNIKVYEGFATESTYTSMVKAFLAKNKIITTNDTGTETLRVELKKVGGFQMVKLNYLNEKNEALFSKSTPIYDANDCINKTLVSLGEFIKFKSK